MIDSHAHIYENVFKNDITSLVNKFVSLNVEKILLPTTNLNEINDAFSLKEKYNNLFDVMIGIHPNNIEENYEEQMKSFEKYLNLYNFIGVGEIGLDFLKSNVCKQIQIKIFQKELAIAKNFNLPVSIHARGAFDDVFGILKNNQNGNLKGVIHCFSGSVNEAEKYINIGFKLGIGGIVTFKNSNLKNVLKKISLTNIVLETDSPYLSPEPNRGERNDPSNLIFIAKTLAEIYNTTIDEIFKQTSINVKSIFKIK